MRATAPDGTQLEYSVDGPANAPVLVFSNSIATTQGMWDAQAAALRDRFRVVRYDTRGHGQSDVPPGPYAIETLGLDLLAVIEAIGAEKGHVCGLSLGGLTAIWLAIHKPERLNRVVFANTAAKIGAPEVWDARIKAVREGGMASIRDASLERFFSEGFRKNNPDELARIGRMIDETPVEGYAGVCGTLRDTDLRPGLAGITTPVLVVGGEHDPSTTAEQARELSAAVPGSELFIVPGVNHVSNIEAPEAFTERLIGFLR
jgi:3-oxoadipate enol-lactonase